MTCLNAKIKVASQIWKCEVMMTNMKELSQVMFTNYPDCVGVQELAQMLGIKRTKTYELLKNGIIKSIKIGKDYKISKFNVIAYLMGGEQV